MMKRLFACLLCLAMLACVPTPEQEFVVNKSEIDQQSVLTQTAAPDGEAQCPIAERIGAPAQWTEETFTRKVPYDTLTIEIDATVHVPDVSCVGVYTATLDVPFSEAQQKGLILKYLGDERPFVIKPDQAYWRKWQYEEGIREIQRDMEKHSLEEDQTMRDIMLQSDNENLETEMESYRSAPEDWTHCEWDGAVAAGRGENANTLMLYANTDVFAHYRSLVITADVFGYDDESKPVLEAEPNLIHVGSRSPIRMEPGTDAERAACEAAKQEVDAFGVGTFEVLRVMKAKKGRFDTEADAAEQNCYIVVLKLCVDGLPVYDFQAWHGNDNIMSQVYSEGLYAEPDYGVYMPSQTGAKVGVRDGEVAMVHIQGMQKLGDCINPDAQLLPFEQIAEIFCEQIGYHYFTGDPDHPDSGKGETLHITDVYLSMLRIRKKDAPEEFLFVPVWDFVGYMESKSTVYDAEDLERLKVWASSLSYLTINAIDGSIIDREQGY